jgi:hypothetical protein
MSKATLIGLVIGISGTVAAAPPSESAQQHAAAEQLCRLLCTPACYEKSLDRGSDLLIENLARSGHPVPSDKRSAVRNAVGETTSYQEMVNQTATVLAARFSLAELKELVGFYGSLAGQRAMQLPELLNSSGLELGQLIARRIAPKLRQIGLTLPDDDGQKTTH